MWLSVHARGALMSATWPFWMISDLYPLRQYPITALLALIPSILPGRYRIYSSNGKPQHPICNSPTDHYQSANICGAGSASNYIGDKDWATTLRWRYSVALDGCSAHFASRYHTPTTCGASLDAGATTPQARRPYRTYRFTKKKRYTKKQYVWAGQYIYSILLFILVYRTYRTL